jgi:hypothetical protein
MHHIPTSALRPGQRFLFMESLPHWGHLTTAGQSWHVMSRGLHDYSSHLCPVHEPHLTPRGRADRGWAQELWGAVCSAQWWGEGVLEEDSLCVGPLLIAPHPFLGSFQSLLCKLIFSKTESCHCPWGILGMVDYIECTCRAPGLGTG